jgi:hypothetical protein
MHSGKALIFWDGETSKISGNSGQQAFTAVAHELPYRRNSKPTDCSMRRILAHNDMRGSISADGVAADLAAGGRGYASSVDHVHARAASLANLCAHVVGLRKLCE